MSTYALDGLGVEIQKLVEEAVEVRKRAHAPYSKFLVGAVIEGVDGNTYASCNVETVAYNNSLHAEMGAISQMVSAGCMEIRRLVVVTESSEPLFPCGFCLQYLIEFGRDSEIFAVDLVQQRYSKSRLGELLPSQFKSEHLNLSH